jgi:hypothetical protein
LVQFSVTHPAGILKPSRAGDFGNLDWGGRAAGGTGALAGAPGILETKQTTMKAQQIAQEALLEKYTKMAKPRRKKSFGQ